MSFKQLMDADADALYQLAGITGFGWTVSVLGYMATVIGYGNTLITRLVADPQSLLYLGGVLFGVTFGLDKLRGTLSKGD